MNTKLSANDLSDLDKLPPREVGKLFPIAIESYNPDWVTSFEEEKAKLAALLGDKILDVEHIGSTAIPSIKSKPIIDILVEVAQDGKVEDDVIEKMRSSGYHFILRSDRTPPHSMFVKGYTTQGFNGQVYHVHMSSKQNTELWDRIYFRDLLIANEQLAKAYEALKLELAIKFKYDREAYTNGKVEFVREVTEIAKLSV